MNAVANPESNLIPDNNGGGSDTDTNPDESPEYYQPISVDGEQSSDDENSDADHEPTFNAISNGYTHCLENGVSSLDLSESDEEDDEEERVREAAELAVRRAFVEDESRRSAPLTAENASRVREAMRGISFGGFAPDWADRLPEDRLISQLRRIRETSSSSAAPVRD